MSFKYKNKFTHTLMKRGHIFYINMPDVLWKHTNILKTQTSYPVQTELQSIPKKMKMPVYIVSDE